MTKVTVLLRQDRLNLDVRLERAEQKAVLFETLTIQGEGALEDRIAQVGKLVQRDIPQVRVNRSEFLVQQGHHISPAVQILSGKSVSSH